jgi:threonine/homoserine/homoserine lactone efflux protein
MLDASTLGFFAIAAFLVLLIPGPAIFEIVTRGMQQGRREALVTVLGVQAGDVLHVILAAAGLTTILVSTPAVFSIITWAGAAYLVLLGFRSLSTTVYERTPTNGPHATLRQCFSRGLAVNLVNPGTTLFYFSLLPQFVEPERGSAGLQMVELGVVAMAVAAVIECAWALLDGAIGARLHGSARFQRIQSGVSAAIFIALGVVMSGVGAV